MRRAKRSQQYLHFRSSSFFHLAKRGRHQEMLVCFSYRVAIRFWPAILLLRNRVKNVIGSERLANSFGSDWLLVCLRCCPKQADDPSKSDMSFDGERATPMATANQSLLSRFQFWVVLPLWPPRNCSLPCIALTRKKNKEATLERVRLQARRRALAR